MSRRFIVRPLAEADLEDAARWYEGERAGLAERFFSDVDRTFARIRERPLQFPSVSGNVHRALLHTFPYAVYFRVASSTRSSSRPPQARCNPHVVHRGREVQAETGRPARPLQTN